MSYFYEPDPNVYDSDDHDTIYADYDHFIDANFEEAWSSDNEGQEFIPARVVRRYNKRYVLRRSASPQNTATIIKSPQTKALDLYKSDSEDSYDHEELAFYLDKSMDIDDFDLKKKARQQDPQVCFHVGQKYDALESMHKAIGWYKLAAAHNHIEAQIAIGNYYESKKELEVAMEWYTKAYNNESGEAAYKLGLICKKCKDKSAMEWFLKAHTSGYVKAASQIGQMYLFGQLGISQSHEQAMEWFTKGDQAGDDGSAMGIGTIYQHGLGVKSDLQEALNWYKKAYQRGNVDAAYEIGRLYDGRNMHVPHPKKEAFKWFYRAAIYSHMDACACLTDLRSEGYDLSSKSQAAIIVERDTDKMKEKYEQEIEALKKEIASKNDQIETLTNQFEKPLKKRKTEKKKHKSE